MQIFLSSLQEDLPDCLDRIWLRARMDQVPVIRDQVQSLLKVLLALQKPERILEIGTATGFSALFMCEYGPTDVQVTTIEKDEKRAAQAAANIADLGRQGQIHLLTGDASRILPSLSPSFDLIFMDAAKGQYIRWLPDMLRLMHTGSVLVSDNCLRGGDILESHFLVERRDRTIFHRMREYLYSLTHTPGLRTTVLPTGDGVSVTVKVEP
ncbi:MAG: O-methyltransferase [Blautia sp.]|nr:O-methyltransferase [Blautia sp.]